MKPVRFTQHAIGKLELLQQWGFHIERERIASDLVRDHESSPGYQGRTIARIQLPGFNWMKATSCG